jgi:uroporphyrinogen-III synthase
MPQSSPPQTTNHVKMSTAKAVGQSIPVLLLKTKSIPNDGYEEHFLESGVYDPVFVPVLEHKFDAEGLQAVNGLLARKLTTEDGDLKYGGMIFTSQRAVEAFAKIVTEFDGMLFSVQAVDSC